MADDPEKPAEAPSDPPAAKAGADQPPSSAPAEPLKAEVSRTDAPGAGASAVPAPQPASPAAPSAAAAKPAAPAAARPAPASGGEASKPAAPAAKAAAKPPAAEHAPKAAPPSGPPDPPPPADKTAPAFITTLQSVIPGAVTQISYWVGDWTIVVPAAQLLEVAKHLRDAPDAAFDLCSDVTATDWPPRLSGRFDVVYVLYSTRHRHRIRVKTIVAESQPLPSVTSVWPAANWLEREIYDMFGVNFAGHPDRRRILMPEDWQGFPQRKDYPLEGPGELLMENPIDWLKLRQAKEEAEIE
jgi:NADH-quinone oxidoreductase subunit C